MEIKDYITIGIAILGWTWAIIQFIISRKHQKYDKILEKRFEVYSNFMNKMDEMNNKMRTDPKMIFGTSSELMATLLSGEEEDRNNALVKFNTELVNMTKKSVEPLLIVNQELNKLKMVCSNEMLPKIEEYKKLTTDYSDEFRIVLNKLSSNKDIEITAKELGNIGHQDRNVRLMTLWKEIETMMRDELGYYSK
ncbi:hypothetical protein [Paludibacter sp.]|uniref:hypothetical protein n=1 Tax=Paludibacter sp. TaxID=1898105 RepID=UPI001352DDFE|nr:hypothetical protein [Paludibacter sp.]MTK51856.1 hypothetical protein [Paludibacter sp.]